MEVSTWQTVSGMPQQCGLKKVRNCSAHRKFLVWKRKAGDSATHKLNTEHWA